MKIHLKDFRVKEGDEVDLKKRPTIVDPVYKSKAQYEEILAEHVAKLERIAATPLCIQSPRRAADLPGDGCGGQGRRDQARDVRRQPAGLPGLQLQAPERDELEHDFLWRTTRDLPERGRIGIFNRSYYEEVLIVRVHPRDPAQRGDPGCAATTTSKLWHGRYRSIVDLERHLHRNGTRIVKFFLHLSKEEQRKRFLARIDEPDKNWKFSLADIEERKFWKHYMKAYEGCLSATSTDDSPWYVVPADDKENARLIVSQIVVDTLEGLGMSYPKVTAERAQQLQSIRAELMA